MLVCPHCRRENAEEASTCANCGRSLSPGEVTLSRAPRREDPVAELDVPPPRQGSPVPAIIGLLVLALGLGGLATWLALRPNPCEGKFASETYPYCVSVPRGWEQGTQGIGESTADRFRTTDATVAVIVVAEEAQGGVDVRRFAENYRRQQEAGGLFPGPSQPIEVAGEQGLAWELAGTNEDGIDIRQRQLAVIHENRAFLITFAVVEERYEQGRLAFENMLETWTWR